MAWTKAQQKVIDARNKNLLVSAAAGSGKTAVLVERIISMISEGEQPLDIDRLLVVTFTKAAAAEMRERIGRAIDKKLIEQPDNLHLQKQSSLLQGAQITTIHSFCLNVIRNYFHRIDLDPSFKIAEDAELTLMKADVISDVLEQWYETGRDDFYALVESYSHSKSDAPIEELILQLYEFSMSAPWPEEWMKEKKKMFDLHSLEDMKETAWMQELLEYIRIILGDLLAKNSEAIQICNETGGPSVYLPALLSDRKLLEQLIQSEDYEEGFDRFRTIAFERLSSKKEEGVEAQKKEQVKALREDVKKGLRDLINQYFFQSPEEMIKDMQAVSPVMQVLFDLALEFAEEFAKKKEDKNLIDFNDLEHFALKILVEKQEGESLNILPSAAAIELSELYQEILIDEYQDSNMVQETILRSISREASGHPNRFMVGDVKQSIYKFRLAMPEIFMEKYENYATDEVLEDGQRNLYQRIDLDKNFRSREIILNYVNTLFEQIMRKAVGGIVYDEAAALKYGELYEKPSNASNQGNHLSELSGDRISDCVDFILVTEEEAQRGEADIEGKDNPAVNEVEETAYTKKDMEARVIVAKIRELTDPDRGLLIMDKATKELRPAVYGDIVILLRSMSGWSDVFINTLLQEGIPAYADTGTGYFQTLEIITILNMLRIIDNPRQDIPFTGVLYSPMVGISTTELAYIRAGSQSVSMYQAVLTYTLESDNPELKDKLMYFVNQLARYRSMVNYKPIHELIQLILDESGYYYYVSAMPGGDQRRANIDMLIAKAVQFERGSYSGLFHFIRYIEKLHKYEIDFGEASITGEHDNTVRIMSIHKSKGLEFPVVFVAGMSKQFNTQDLRSSIVLHSEFGAGPEYIDSKQRTKVPTLLKKVIQKKLQTENLGEELRVLYVAMTRAREKLILTGYIKSTDDLKGRQFSFYELLHAKSFMDWVMPAMVNRIGQLTEPSDRLISWTAKGMSIQVITREELVQKEAAKQMLAMKDKLDLFDVNDDMIYDPKLREEIRIRSDFSYPYDREAGIKIKMTVSELKRLGQYQNEETGVRLYPSKEAGGAVANEREIPAFINRRESEASGADRGTLYHRVLELLDLSGIDNEMDLKRELETLAVSKHIRREEINLLNIDYIFGFIQSDIAKRMRKAQLTNCLYKEKQFVMGIKANELIKATESEELILIQGIMDAYFEEDGELVLVDYKSDLVTSEEELVSRYRVQLQYYKRALEQMLHKTVKEMVIYSLPLKKEIRIDT